jgi:hypothetical protein
MRLGARLAGAALALLWAPSARAMPLTTDESLALTILLQPRLDLTPRDEGGVVDPIVDRA